MLRVSVIRRSGLNVAARDRQNTAPPAAMVMWPQAGRAILITICKDPGRGPGTAIAAGVANRMGSLHTTGTESLGRRRQAEQIVGNRVPGGGALAPRPCRRLDGT